MAPDINNEEIKTACRNCIKQVVFLFPYQEKQ